MPAGTIVPIDLQFAFVYGDEKSPSKDAPYFISCKVSKDLASAYLRLEYIDLNGNIRPRDAATDIIINSEELSFYIERIGGSDLVIAAYASENDADNQNNPIALSDTFNIAAVISLEDNDSDNPDNSSSSNPENPEMTPQEEEKYADIVFKNGYAYFGEYPQSKVADKTVITALNALTNNNPGSRAEKYNNTFFQYAEILNKGSWYEAKPVEWVILEGSADSDTVTLMANVMLLCTGFTDYNGYTAHDGWDKSFLRYHLNSYNGKTFKSIWTYDIMGVLIEGNAERVLLEQTYGKCSDKILLPTKAQVESFTAKKRIRSASDMTTVAGSYGYWLLDSAGSGKQYIVNSSGTITTAQTWKQEYGVVPVIKIDLTKCNIIKK